MKITKLTTTEEQLMQLFWKLNSFYMKEVMEQHPEPKPHQNTVSTYLKILHEKGFLRTTKEGRINQYHIAIGLKDYRNFLLLDFLDSYYQNSTAELLNHLIEKKLVKKEQIRDFLEMGTNTESLKPTKKEESVISDFINEITPTKKDKKKNKEKKKKKKKKD